MKLVNVFKTRLLSFFDNRFTRRSQFKGDANLLDENYPVDGGLAPKTITQNLIMHAYMSNGESLRNLGSDIDGLTQKEVDEKIDKFGYNEIDKHESLTWYTHLWLSYKNPFNLLLTILAAVSYLTDDIKGAVVIGGMVLISTVLRFVQERRSNNAADKLKAMVSTTATVVRHSEEDDEDDEQHEHHVDERRRVDRAVDRILVAACRTHVHGHGVLSWSDGRPSLSAPWRPSARRARRPRSRAPRPS